MVQYKFQINFREGVVRINLIYEARQLENTKLDIL